MIQVIRKDNYRVPVFSWCTDIEDSAQEQIDHLAQLPFVSMYVGIMSDAHAGYGMPIGGVIACDKVVVINSIGVDIGCGVLAVKTNLKRLDINTLLCKYAKNIGLLIMDSTKN